MTGVTAEVAKRRERKAKTKQGSTEPAVSGVVVSAPTPTPGVIFTKSGTTGSADPKPKPAVVRAKPPQSRLTGISVSKQTIERRVEIPGQVVKIDFSETEVRDILVAHALNTLIPARYKASKTKMPATLDETHLNTSELMPPVAADGFYDEDEKYKLTMQFVAE